MNVTEVLKKENITVGLEADSKEKVIEALVDILYKSGALSDKKSFSEDVLNREKVSETGIGNAIAIPHGKSASVKETSAAAAILKTPVKWGEDEDEPVQFVVLLAVNENDKGNTHVRLLSQMARHMALPENCKKLTEAKSGEEIINIFSK